MRFAGITVSSIDGSDPLIQVLTFSDPMTHREVVANGMIMTMEHEIKKIIEHYKKFTERGIVLNNEGELNEL